MLMLSDYAYALKEAELNLRSVPYHAINSTMSSILHSVYLRDGESTRFSRFFNELAYRAPLTSFKKITLGTRCIVSLPLNLMSRTYIRDTNTAFYSCKVLYVDGKEIPYQLNQGGYLNWWFITPVYEEDYL